MMLYQSLTEEFALDFVVVGAEKSGTSWLSDKLKQHPQVFIPSQKELHYFNTRFVEDPTLRNYNHDKPLSWYISFFKEAHDAQKKGEVCPSYLWDEQAAKCIWKVFPNAKIVILLRNPVERTFSAYRYYLQRGIITRDNFRQALNTHADILLSRSKYYPQVKRYLDVFPSEHVSIFFYDDLKKSNEQFLLAVERFLDVEDYIPPEINKRSNLTAVPRSRWLGKFLYQIRALGRKHSFVWLLDAMRRFGIARSFEAWRMSNQRNPEPTEIDRLKFEDRRWLLQYFDEDIRDLENLLGVDLGMWRS